MRAYSRCRLGRSSAGDAAPRQAARVARAAHRHRRERQSADACRVGRPRRVMRGEVRPVPDVARHIVRRGKHGASPAAATRPVEPRSRPAPGRPPRVAGSLRASGTKPRLTQHDAAGRHLQRRVDMPAEARGFGAIEVALLVVVEAARRGTCRYSMSSPLRHETGGARERHAARLRPAAAISASRPSFQRLRSSCHVPSPISTAERGESQQRRPDQLALVAAC